MSIESERPSVAPTGPFHFVDVLRQHVEHARSRPKRLRTRAQLLLATAEELERVGYEGLTVDLVTASAGVARGTFYRHFDDRVEAATVINRMYFSLVRRRRPRGSRFLEPLDATRRYNTYYVAIYQLNAKLLLGRESLWQEKGTLRNQRDAVNARWTQIVKRDVLSRREGDRRAAADPTLELRIRAAIAMVDELLRDVYLHRLPSLERYGADQQLLVEVLSDLWHRMIHSPGSG